jgi:hypothetical protein
MALQVTVPLYLIISFDIWSGPALFPIFNFWIHLFISWTVKGPSVTSFINKLSILKHEESNNKIELQAGFPEIIKHF